MSSPTSSTKKPQRAPYTRWTCFRVLARQVRPQAIPIASSGDQRSLRVGRPTTSLHVFSRQRNTLRLAKIPPGVFIRGEAENLLSLARETQIRRDDRERA